MPVYCECVSVRAFFFLVLSSNLFSSHDDCGAIAFDISDIAIFEFEK